MTSKFIVLQVFINQGYRSVCHYHAEIDHSIAKNDDSRKKSTGVYKPVGESCAPEELRRLIPKKKPSSIEVLEGAVEWPEKGPTQTSNGLTMDDLLKFYRKVDGWYFLTCGCLLDDVLLDFYIWKAQQYIPSMYGHETPFGTPMEPRVRTWLFAFLKSEMDICVDNLYAYDEDGVYRSWERRSVIQIKNIWHSLERKAARSMVLDVLNLKEKGADLEPWEWSDKDRKSEQEARKALQREWEKASKEEREREEQRRKELEEEDAWMDGGKEEDGERKKRKKKKKKSREEDEGEGKEKKKKKKKRKASRSPSPSDPSGSRPKKRKSD
ncbi:hypothetical protein CC1G_13394 [Coprinopsis cinerea okayama7|uniref:Uncharacterized protein n=1 Tax=Coprinopsis cinerea (strain Okayama-7 / 130 / ATCC MYA-4618 / FGSC 9003) TaxID=240176 RepID=A8NJZ1_COPC7|nr:hypothetical protein CC1G_13394 [Coprinopsis cinerea okayama7\|eukprot:XP_001834326.2 hypothetical protein CC1G_13394 [Coprinopsis cinerea okayama7\